jgi:peptide/nickel transport system substrate-binding protein
VEGDFARRQGRMKVARAAALLSAVALLGGCTSASTTRTSAGANAWTHPGIVRIADNQEPNSLVRMFSHQAAADDVTALLFEPLFRFDDRGRPVPSLATVFPSQANGLISKDGLRVTFRLRPNALWADGVPVTASDLIFTWHAITNGDNPVGSTAGYDDIAAMIADNPHQVTMVLKEPYAPAVYLFSEGSYPPLPAHLLAKYDRIDRLSYDEDPVGDGPFVLKRWDHGADMIFVPNPKYWRGKAKLDEIDIRIIPDSVTDLNALKTHDIDVLDGVAKSLAVQLPGIDGIRVIKQLSANYRHLDFDTKNPILSDVAVRRAIAMGIDFDRIIKTVYAGFGVRGASAVPPISWAANDLKPLPYDPARASALLDADGWVRSATSGMRSKDGQPLVLTISTATESRQNQSAEELASSDLRAIGIDLEIKNYATTVLFAPAGPLYGGHYDMAWIIDTEGTDPDNLGSVGCDYFPPAGANTTFYCDPRVDRLLRDAELHYDPARRRADYTLASNLLIDDAPYVIAYWDVNLIAVNTDLKNFKPSPFITDFWNAWEWQI